MRKAIFTVFTDGGKKRGIAYGSFKIFNIEGIQVAHKQLIFGDGTSNLAEFMIIVSAMTFCISKNILDIAILSDSRLAVMQINGEWNSNYPHLQKARKQIWALRDGFETFSIKHVKNNLIKSILGH